ncbi:scavenger receptor cysteine-rich type 1 protein M130 [Amia ocellicauda]|uniref:scavenger receptor cysteine-rich type 1 protein M130 n=1 Tax=Amia ocellicauda TaxID=2972642 RepID=UPI003464CCAB
MEQLVKGTPVNRDTTIRANNSFTDHRGVRLVGGNSFCSGRVEVQLGQNWGTVCDADFDWQDAEVVCRQLNCGIPSDVLGMSHFGSGEGQVWSEEIQCKGNESQLFFCPSSTTQKPGCNHTNDVGLVCFGYTDSRLLNGTDSCSGRVELMYLNEWGTVCDRYWDLRDANVLCRQMNCGFALAALGQARFGEGTGVIWKDHFNCDGSESHLKRCSIFALGQDACFHGSDAGVICSGSSLTAVSPVDGHWEDQVEVYYNGIWRRILENSLSFREASVVCRQLGCGSAIGIYN